MTLAFDEWWNKLSSSERAVIGRNNALFVWRQAFNACADICDDIEGKWWDEFKNSPLDSLGRSNVAFSGKSDGAGECSNQIRKAIGVL